MIYIFLNIAIILSFCIYWCVNEKIGLQLSIVILLSAWTFHLINNMDIKFPVDIEIGWLIIAIFIFGYILLRKILERLFLKGGYRAYMIATAVISFSLIIYHPGINFIVPGGVIFGLGIGYCLNKKHVGFDSANLLQRTGILKYVTLLARLALGITILILMVYRVERIIFGMTENQNIYLYGFLCYTLIGFWVTIAAPWLFIKLRIAGIKSDIITPNEDTSSKTKKKPGHKYGSHWFQG